MFGISSSGKDAIGKLVEDVFDRIALQFIGNIPKLKNKKLLVVSSKPNLGLTNLFVQAMSNKKPNEIESDALKSLLNSAHGYVEALKNKTKSNITESIDGLVKQAKIKGENVSEEDVQAVISEEMRKAKSHMTSIVEAESTKMRNVGSMMDISRVSSNLGESDPTVFFTIVRDGKTCTECKRLHLNDDGTPRVWKLSELKQGYHKRGEDYPSALGEHPLCRCHLTYLVKNFGFDKSGRVTYIGEGHDEHKKQRS